MRIRYIVRKTCGLPPIHRRNTINRNRVHVEAYGRSKAVAADISSGKWARYRLDPGACMAFGGCIAKRDLTVLANWGSYHGGFGQAADVDLPTGKGCDGKRIRF